MRLKSLLLPMIRDPVSVKVCIGTMTSLDVKHKSVHMITSAELPRRGYKRMDLTTWMAKNNATDEQIALAVGCTRPYITRIRNGVVHPNLGTALDIWDYTKQEVDIRQLLPKYRRPALKQPSLPARPRGRPRKPAEPKASRSRAAA